MSLQDSYTGELHIPSLARRVVDFLGTAEGRVVVDCTIGYGGHAERVLDSGYPPSLLIGIDRDPEAISAAEKRLRRFGSKVLLFRSRFSELDAVLAEAGVESVGGILYDLGVSTPQLEVARRGFSYMRAGPLDMRMDPDAHLTAGQVVNEYPPSRLVAVIERYGEERHARKIVREIVRRRPLRTTADLVAAIEAALPKGKTSRGRKPTPGEGHPARRVFQAIRIEVNREIDELRASLPKALDALDLPESPSGHGGRIVCISYHSLEDRVVKRFIERAARGCVCPPDLPVCGCGARPVLKKLTRRVVRPSQKEIQENPRARSARLRAAERTGDWGEDAMAGVLA